MVKNSQKFKVAVVGAGTIGLYLAWKLSEAGHQVIVFERNPKILAKPCSGLISERLKSFISLDSDLIESKINSCLIHFPRKIIALNFKPIHFIINRQKLNEKLAQLVENSGAEILFNQFIDEIPAGFDKIIGCDGALSKIREKLDLSQPSLRLALQVFSPAKTRWPGRSDQVEVWPITNGFFWKIPRGELIEYGGLGSPISIKKTFEKFAKTQKIDFKEKRVKSALVPGGLTLPKSKPHSRETSPQGKNITLCGDAAGLTKPWSGGGVIWGLTAAEILIKNFPDFKKYHQEIKKFFRPKILKGKIVTHLAYFLGKNFSFILPSKITRDNDFPFF